ncbi:DUF447 domain-containing protein [[Eubacterium] cellulosolvens]
MNRGKYPKIEETYEIILSTYCDDDQPNAAPMGIKFLTNRKVFIRFFKGTRTLNNILKRRCAIANVTSDPLLFYKTTFKEKNHLPTNYFSRSKIIDAPYLRSADGYVQMTLTMYKNKRSYVETEFNIKEMNLKKIQSKLYSRGAHAVIEAIIHSTRIKEFLAKGNRKKTNKLIPLVNYYKELIERVSPESDYEKIINEIQTKINKWKNKKSIR